MSIGNNTLTKFHNKKKCIIIGFERWRRINDRYICNLMLFFKMLRTNTSSSISKRRFVFNLHFFIRRSHWQLFFLHFVPFVKRWQSQQHMGWIQKLTKKKHKKQNRLHSSLNSTQQIPDLQTTFLFNKVHPQPAALHCFLRLKFEQPHKTKIIKRITGTRSKI